MARKFDLISELYNRTSKTVIANPQSWQSFLSTACYNYKLRFDEQLLIYAQRPDATAVLEIERWNEGFGRWVNKGARGIAVFADENRSRQRLKHYFDISDTHGSRYAKPVPIWEMNSAYTDDIIEALEGTFGELEDKHSLEAAIFSASRNAVEDNLPDYLTDLLRVTENSFLEGLDDFNVEVIYKRLVTNSVAYTMMSRLGLDTSAYFERDDFADVMDFNTADTLNAIGFATSDIAEMGLAEISRTIQSLNRQNRTFAASDHSDYNVDENKTERSNEYGEDQLHDARRLSSSRSDDAGAAGSDLGTVRRDEAEVPEGASQGAVLQSADEMHPDGASGRNGDEGHRDGGILSPSDGGEGGLDREPESNEYDGLGSENEQSEERSAGDRESGSDFRLDYYDRSHEDTSLPFLGSTPIIHEILRTTPHLKASKEQIRSFFEQFRTPEQQTAYVKSIFNNDYTEVILANGERYGYKTYQNVLHLWKGSYLRREAQSFYDWGVIAQHFEGMRLLGELYDTAKPLPSMEGQMNLIELAGEEKAPAFSFSQEIIDRVLTRGSGVSEGKMRIYEQFQKSLSHAENAEFLKNEYGWGGSYPIIIGTDIDESHDTKGITISLGIGSDKPHIDLKWTQVEKRIDELIRMNRYLNPKELDQYPEWLAAQEERRRENAERRKVAEILKAAPPEPAPEMTYEYHLGDKVYLGANEYEILSFDDERVMLYDTEFPLFNREETRADFDRMVAENPMNNHLKVPVQQAEAQTITAEEKAEISTEAPMTDIVSEYNGVKENAPDSIVLYQVGDFFEVLGSDAETVSQALDLSLTSRSISATDRIPMCGFPQHTLQRYMDMLLDRGYDLTIATLETGKRVSRTVVSSNRDEPVESYPVGRIDHLGTDGTVKESIEYTSEYQFKKDIQDENFYGVPMTITVYRQKDGSTIDTAFISELDPPPQGFKVEDFIPPENPLMEQAKKLIDAFCRSEYDGLGADFSDMTSIGIGYTTVLDSAGNEYDIQVTVDLEHYCVRTEIGNRLFREEQFTDLQEMVDKFLPKLYFDDLVYVSEEVVDEFVSEKGLDDFSDIDPAAVREALAERGIVNGEVVDAEKLNADPFIQQVRHDVEQAENAAQPVIPTWEQKPKSKAQTFDLHPDIPMADWHTFDLASHEVEEVGKKERFRRNLMAIQLLKKCQQENRFATPEEQEILSKYVGWGGIPEAFDENNASWGTEYLELRSVLTPEEYNSAKESTLTAFYTPPAVINGIYKVLEQMGFRDGNLLEPSCGIGNFIGMLPQSMQNAKFYGVEIDTISAGIAQQLYQKTSIAAQPFEEANVPDSFFDGIVGNVPFGDFKVLDKRYDKYHFLIHDYFMAKSLDKLRPGGVMALVTSKGTMDKENPAVRKYIAQRAELLGAIRLPNNTFKGNAGTEVVSDILIFQKRDRLIDIEPDWVHLDVDENGNKMNAYFVQHPEMILGEVRNVSGRFGEEQTVVPYEGTDLAAQIEEAVENIHGEITEYQIDNDEMTEEDNSIPADPTVRNFSYIVLDDKVYYRENSRMAPVTLSETAANRIKGMITIRDTARRLLEMQTENYPDADIQAEQAKLNRVYDDFTKKYGLINSRANISAFSQDSSFSLLSALEVIGDDGQLERKADMFFKRTIKPHTPVTSVDTASEALAVSIGEKACIDMAYMSELSGKTEEELLSELKGVIFLNPLYEYGNHPEGKYLMADEYLSGNVREKLKIAKNSAALYPEDYTVNVEALEKVQPKDLTASEIFVRLGSTWVPPEIIEQFMFEFLGTPRYAQWNMKVHYSQYTSEWNIENKSYDRSNVKAYSTYGTSRINAYKIIEETLNLKDVRIFDYVEDTDGKKHAVLNAKETAIAQAKQEQIKQGFQDWVWTDPERRERLCKLYNEKFNSVRPREYDGSHITFNGMNPEIELREHQKNAVAHILYGGNTLLAHCVGAGKTFEMTAAAMEAKRLGLCNKSLFVVPNHLTEQWAAEFLQLYPAANILVATKKDFETKNRKRFCGRIATGDYDAVIIGHSQFEKIPMSIERQRAILEQELDEVVNGIAEMKRNRGENFSVKQLQKSKKSIETKLKKLNDQSRKDDLVTFEELGVDRLFIDESHYYKNLFLYTKMRNVGGIAQTEAQKSSDLFMKCRYLDEITGGRGTVFATGTPISNSMVELYTIQRYLQYNTLVRNDLQHFDAWASAFGETVTAVELKPEGTGYRTKTRFSRFFNLPELMAMFKEVADIKTADMLDLPVPEAHYHNVAAKPSDMQKEMVAGLAERAEKVRAGGVNASVDNMLKITNDGRKLALDQRMINPLLPDFEGSKVNACVDNIFRIWDENADKKSAQLVFCDLSTPKSEEEFSVYTDIRRKLIERGIPAEEIKFIHEADTEAKKQELFKKVRKGEVRVLLGSTQKMGAGTNCQDRLIALHDIDCPWRPSDLEQRSGRIIRQGNQNSEVDIYRYVTEGTFDAYLYQLIEGKQKFSSQIMTSKSPVRSAEDIDATALSYAEIKMLATGNPYIKEKMDLDIQVQKLRLLKASFLSEKYALEDKIIKFYPQQIARLKETIAGLEGDVQTVKVHPKPDGEQYVGIEVKGVFYSEKADAGKAIIEACKAMNSPDPVPLGKYCGFDLELSFNTTDRLYEVKIRGKTSRTIALGEDIHGNLTRIDNALDKFADSLEANKNELENTIKQFETAKVEVEKPFSKEEELKQMTQRLDELNILLNLDKHENELADDEPDEGDSEPERKDRGQER